LNYITTSHDKSSEAGSAHMLYTQFQFGYFIREHIHSHPANTDYSSGLEDGEEDVGFASWIEKYIKNSKPILIFFTTGNATYIQYNKDSKPEDYYEPIEYPEIIITPKD
jgi:hypothetical protein